MDSMKSQPVEHFIICDSKKHFRNISQILCISLKKMHTSFIQQKVCHFWFFLRAVPFILLLLFWVYLFILATSNTARFTSWSTPSLAAQSTASRTSPSCVTACLQHSINLILQEEFQLKFVLTTAWLNVWSLFLNKCQITEITEVHLFAFVYTLTDCFIKISLQSTGPSKTIKEL